MVITLDVGAVKMGIADTSEKGDYGVFIVYFIEHYCIPSFSR
jgi:hypothetical protein